MFTKIKEGINQGLVMLYHLVDRVRQILAPAIKVGTIISVVYSALAIIIVFKNQLPEFLFSTVIRIPHIIDIFTILCLISMATLVLSGGIIEALMLFLSAATFFSDCFSEYDPYEQHGIEELFKLALILIPIAIALLIIICLPTVFILVHKYKNYFE